MPEMTFTVRWPDGTVAELYSPSLVMHDFLSVGQTLPLDDFVSTSSEALDIASQRVKAKFGFECTSAIQQKAEIVSRAVALQDAPDVDGSSPVEVLAMQPGLEP